MYVGRDVECPVLRDGEAASVNNSRKSRAVDETHLKFPFVHFRVDRACIHDFVPRFFDGVRASAVASCLRIKSRVVFALCGNRGVLACIMKCLVAAFLIQNALYSRCEVRYGVMMANLE